MYICWPVLWPQMIGTGAPPVTTNLNNVDRYEPSLDCLVDNYLVTISSHTNWCTFGGCRDKSLQQLPIWGALVSSWVRLLYLHLVKIQPQLTHIWARLHIFHINLRNGDGADLFNGGWTLANGVEWAGVAIVDKVGWVVVGARSTVILQHHHFISLTGCKSIHKEI